MVIFGAIETRGWACTDSCVTGMKENGEVVFGVLAGNGDASSVACVLGMLKCAAK